MEEYPKGAYTLFDIQYPLGWVTKYRYPVLRGEVAERTREIVRQVCMSRDIHILQGQVRADPVHVLVLCPPLLGPAKTGQYL